MSDAELLEATERNRDLENRWVSLFTHLARTQGDATEAFALDLGEDGLKAIRAFERERAQHPTVGFNELHFIAFPHFVKLAGKRRVELQELGNPPGDWLPRLNKQMPALTDYRNHLAHVNRFAYLPLKRQREAIDLFDQQIRQLDE